MSFYLKNKRLFCEDLSVKDIQGKVAESPFYLYSLKRITDNYRAYAEALKDLNAMVLYAFKANGNLAILKHLRKLGSGAVLVSGNEIRLAHAAGFSPKKTIFNGNGKTMDELNLAVDQGVMINIDSEFDLEHISKAAGRLDKPTRVLLRVNPEIDPSVHPYVSTGIRNSKFGIQSERLDWFLERLENEPRLNLVGLHCHLGSTIKEVNTFRDAVVLMMDLLERARQKGFDLDFLNLGGGLGIDYEGRTGSPTASDFVGAIRDVVTDDVTLIIEPGRSIVGDAGALVCKVVGVKTNDHKNFIVIDGSMAELIRPSLYHGYHYIGFVEPVDGEVKTYDIVGPVCESADFLGKDRELATPPEGAGIVVYDVGAYGYVMSSNYNARMRPPEYLVDGDRLIQIRSAEKFDEYLKQFDVW